MPWANSSCGEVPLHDNPNFVQPPRWRLPLGNVARLSCGHGSFPAEGSVVQMAVAQTVDANRDRIVSGIAQAAARDVRVAVFPEGVLRGQGGDDQTIVSEAVEAIRRAARESNVYVVFRAEHTICRI